MLYEIAFAFGAMECKFNIFSTIPRTLIPQEMSLEDAAALSSVLSVEVTAEDINIVEMVKCHTICLLLPQKK